MTTYGRVAWDRAADVPGALPHCLCAGMLEVNGARRGGGCVRIHERWILTAHHVIDVPDLARRVRVRFNRFAGIPPPVFEYRLDPDAGYFASRDGMLGPSGLAFDLDYVFVALAGPFPTDDPSLTHRARAARASPAAGGRAHIAQPSGLLPKLMFPRERLQAFPDAGRVARAQAPYLYYQTSTRAGVSGSPVFDEDWNVAAIHTAGRFEGDALRPLRREFNCGTLMAAILEDVRANHPDFPDIVTLAG